MDSETLPSTKPMDSGPLPPIPTPPGQHWREFRIRALPPFVFILVLTGVFMTWSKFVQPVSLVGQVETNAVNVITTQAGLLMDLALNRFDEVTNGQIIAQVAPYDPDQIKAELAALASSASVVSAKAELMEWGKLDNAIMIRLQLFEQQTLLDIARVKFEQASNEVVRNDKIFHTPNAPLSEVAYMALVSTRDALKSEVVGRSKVIESWTRELVHLGPDATNIFEKVANVLKDDILFQQEQLLQLQKPVVLRAPVSGKISAMMHHAGERVASGAAIVTITSSKANLIVAYVRQPINYRPKLGDVVTVRTRNTRRRTSEAQIVKIGTQLEPIGPLLLPLAKTIPELGLAIALTLPPELDLLPGEVVDLKFSKQ